MQNSEEFLQEFHEIKNSITFIGSSLQLLAQQHPDITDYSYWTEIMDEFSYLRKMITHVSHKQNTEPLLLTPLDLKHVFNCVSSSIKCMETTDEFFCNMSIAENLPLCMGDEFRLKSILTNLIKNAFEAMNQKGTIFLRALPDNDQVRIELQDFGGGIQKEMENRIFDAFYTSKENGSGLGLPICKQFVLEMNGSIFCESRIGDGCTFTLLLPITKP
ncbi:MAG: HAMP domain-containing sensor histidine kinase [Lachnospiraceae bacterium]